ncbi:hypothetical protein LZ32DRAFT_405925 [Colletotrichum eremochloae]|nr:hypothetical protein LZ32DRAFT_405925 [Colletotrichum eremochloae]
MAIFLFLFFAIHPLHLLILPGSREFWPCVHKISKHGLAVAATTRERGNVFESEKGGICCVSTDFPIRPVKQFPTSTLIRPCLCLNRRNSLSRVRFESSTKFCPLEAANQNRV